MQDHYEPTRKRSDYVKAMKTWSSIKTSVSADGMDWMLPALDGFHDGPLKNKPFPSGDPDKVVVHEITRTIDVAKPPSLAAGNWDFVVVTNPYYGGESGNGGLSPLTGFNTRQGFSLQAYKNGNYVNFPILNALDNNQANLDCPLWLIRVPTGTPIWNENYALKPEYVGGIDIPPQYLAGDHRVTAEAVEVVNTTNQLTVNGAVTLFQAPLNAVPSVVNLGIVQTSALGVLSTAYVSAPTGTNTAFSPPYSINSTVEMGLSSPPPADVATASLTQGSLTWPAKYGCYFNSTFSSMPEFSKLKPRLTALTFADSPTPTNISTIVALRTPGWTDNGPNGVIYYQETAETSWPVSPLAGGGVTTQVLNPLLQPTGFKPTPRKGAWFENLDNTATFRVSVRWRVERKPTLLEPDIYSLADTAPPADPLVWEAYTQACSKMPIGCMVDENPLGEWMNSVAKVLREYAPKVGAAVNQFLPGAGIAGNSISALAGLVERATAKGAARAMEESEAYRTNVLRIPKPLPALPAGYKVIAGAPKKGNNKKKKKKGK